MPRTLPKALQNLRIPLIGSPFERQLLKDSLRTILECLAATLDKNMMREREVRLMHCYLPLWTFMFRFYHNYHPYGF